MRAGGPVLLLLLPTLAPACAPPPAELVVEPSSGPSTGYHRIALESPAGEDLAAATSVTLAGVRGLALQPDGERLTFLSQGCPEPGDVEVVVTLPEVTLRAPYVCDPPLDPRFDRVLAFGASFTQGVQDGVPTYHGALHNPALQVARQLGAYFPVPALAEGLLPTIEIEDLGPPPDCIAPDPEAHASAEAAAILGTLLNPDTGEIDFALGRADPELEPHDVAVGGTDIEDMLEGTDDFGLRFMSHLVYDPWSSVADPVPPQIEIVEALQPTLVISTDTYGNDVISAILGDDGIDPGDITDADRLLPAIDELVARLEATGAHSFLANVPRPSLLPAMPDRRRYTIGLLTDDGADPADAEAEVDALIAETDAIAEQTNAHLAAAAAATDNVHVVDLYAEFDRLVADGGVVAGGQQLTARRFGGVVTLDGLHFSDTGYALLANLVLDAIDAELGTDVGRVDLDDVIANDRRSPDALLAAGWDASLCVD